MTGPFSGAALTRQYGWFRAHADELMPIYRDFASMPASGQERTRAENRRIGGLLVGDAAPVGVAGSRMHAAARHVLDYRTWRSLAVDQELDDADAVEVGVELLTALAKAPERRRAVRPRRCRAGA